MTAAHANPRREKRQALEQVLQSVTFLRASQVRNFLRYICEMELAGRGRDAARVPHWRRGARPPDRLLDR